MQRTKISTTNAPAAIGPYNQAIRCGHSSIPPVKLLLIRQLVSLLGDDVQTQTHPRSANLQACT